MLWTIVKKDLYRYTGRTFTFSLFLQKLMVPGFRYTFLMRVCRYSSRYNPIRFLSIVFLRHYRFKYGYQVPYQTEIGPGLYISHFGSIVVNSKSVIGKNCNFAHNITIGQTNRGSKKGAPTLGDRVWVGTGSVIVGKVTIGNNVLIAPNSYVNFDIPSNSIAIGNPTKIIMNEVATEGYINRTID